MKQQTLERLTQEALMKIGRNLLSYQRIESGLKIVTPYLAPTSGKGIAPPPLDIQGLLSDKQTLGPLVQRLKDGADAGNSPDFELYMTRFCTSRNEFVHHFFQRDDATLDSEEKCRSVIAYLDEQDKFLQPMMALLQSLFDAFSFLLDQLPLSEVESGTSSPEAA